MKKILLFSFFYLILTVVIFRNVFLGNQISGGDYVIFWPENIAYLRAASFLAWDSTVNFGLNSVGLLHYAPYNLLISWIGLLVGDQTFLWERIAWWIPFFIFSFLSIITLYRRVLPGNSFWLFSPLIFIFNTYVLMLLGGGQIAGIGLAYAIAPFVFYGFITIMGSAQKNVRDAVFAGLVLAIQIMLDLRITYVTLIGVGLYFLFSTRLALKQFLHNLLYGVFIPFLTAGLLHMFWIIPALLFRVNTIEQLGPAFSSVSAVKFFSFAALENTLSLLHPNWPENLFGKVYFMRWEFLFVPLLAFGSLLFIDKKSQKIILFFVCLSLVGAFLAKGANDPLGQIYLWMFDHVPGFIMFRDPTKFYLLLLISYSILIPFTLYSIFIWLQKKFTFPKYLSFLFITIIIGYFLFLIFPALTGKLPGTFRSTQVPHEYQQLENFLTQDTAFSRTLWLPKRNRFVFLTQIHPAVDADTFLQVSSPSGVLTILKDEKNEKLLQEAGIKYVILPEDSQKELFLKDNKYNNQLHQLFKKELEQLSWLKKTQQFGNIVVYEVANPKEKFWLNSEKGDMSYQISSSTHYFVEIKNASKDDILVYTDSFDPNWLAKEQSTHNTLMSKLYGRELNSFVLPRDGDYTLEVTFAPQQWVVMGGWISLATLVLISIILFKRER